LHSRGHIIWEEVEDRGGVRMTNQLKKFRGQSEKPRRENGQQGEAEGVTRERDGKREGGSQEDKLAGPLHGQSQHRRPN